MDEVTPWQIEDLVKLSTQPIGDTWLDAYYTTYEPNVSTRINYYRFLYHLVELLKPSIAVELGVEFGVASAYMAAAASFYGGQVIGIDCNWHGGPGEDVPAKYPNYDYWVGKSTDPVILERLYTMCDDDYRIGLVFQDSSHHYAESVQEWRLYRQLLAEHAVWVCDDITEAFYEEGIDEKSMVGYWDELPGLKSLYPDVLHKGNTIGVLLT